VISARSHNHLAMMYFGRILIGDANPLHGEVTAVGTTCALQDAICRYDETGPTPPLEPPASQGAL